MIDDHKTADEEPDEEESTFAAGLLGLLKDMAANYPREDHGPALLPLGGVGRFEGEAFVDLKETRFGRPLRVTRDLLKRGDAWGLQVRDAERVAHLNSRDAEDYLGQLVDAGYLVAPGPRDECYDCRGLACHHDYRSWKLTGKGRTLGHASGRQPSTRKRADALAAKVVKAAATINADPDATLWWVKEIRAAGAYADPQQDPLLHVDLAVVLRPCLDDPAEQRKAEARLRDAAEDRHERVRAWDLNGYGHFQTRLALAGRSKVVRLFHTDSAAQGPLLFHEDRDLTVKAAPTAAYTQPTQPESLPRCSWCQREEPSERIAPRGEPVSTSPIGLCRLCSQLGHSDSESSFGWYQPRHWTLRETRTALTQQPHHPEGCALCGRPDGGVRSWWTDREEGEKESAPFELRLCSLCPGLLELADRPDRERWWNWRYQSATLRGMHQIMRDAVNLPALPAKPGTRKPARLTNLHHTLLAQIRLHGVLSPLDMARSTSSQRHQDSQWWTVRFGHLLDNGLLTPLGATDAIDLHSSTETRATSEEEQELRRQMAALFIPGPFWDGSAVREIDPPASWQSLRERSQTLTRTLDSQARALQAATAGTPL
ncbi:hypothetical protein [Streptomyces sp. NPDC050485]|uniref:hypothetical protein n=1 Tax=Streptomyces sp. NPDC050485 TaxID=3365617 RepID=UPI0037A62561